MVALKFFYELAAAEGEIFSFNWRVGGKRAPLGLAALGTMTQGNLLNIALIGVTHLAAQTASLNHNSSWLYNAERKS